MSIQSLNSSQRIVVGLVSGVAVGLFLGELAAPLKLVADGFIKLLQMTVLPYMTVSIISSLGRLSHAQAKRLGLRVAMILVLLWMMALCFVFLFPLVLPKTETATFFSTALLEQPPTFNLLDLYIPANPFHSLANNIVPAIVLFSVVVGVALIGVEAKETLLEVLASASAAISRATRFVVGLTPYGIFAIAAHATGMLNFDQMGRIELYLITYVVFALLVSLWVLPGLVAALTPVGHWEMLGATRDALLTAFMAGDLFIVLPILMEACEELLRRHPLPDPNASRLPEVIVPASFNFPHVGKLLSISFILFAGWFADAALSPREYPKLAVTGLLTFFGSLNAAVPFLLDLFRIPADTFQLFLATSVINSRFGTLVAAIHTVTLALLCSVAIAGGVRFHSGKLIRYITITLVLSAATIGGLRAVFATILRPIFHGAEMVYGMKPLFAFPEPRIVKEVPPPVSVSGGVVESIRTRGLLRVGFLERHIPFTFPDEQGVLMGFDVEMANILAKDLGVEVAFVDILEDDAPMSRSLDRGECDIVMSGHRMTPQRLTRMLFSQPYMDETLAFVVKDHMKDQFSTWENIRSLGAVRIGVRNVAYYLDELRNRLPLAKIERIPLENNIYDEGTQFDVLAMPAERGSLMTLLHPAYTVVIPEPGLVKVPLAYPLARHDERWAHLINGWIELKQKNGTIDALSRHWFMGEHAVQHQPRWSIIRNLLGWVQ